MQKIQVNRKVDNVNTITYTVDTKAGSGIVAKQSINMRLDKEILEEAKKVLGQKETTATVEMALQIIINNRKAMDIFRKTSGKSKWEGFVRF